MRTLLLLILVLVAFHAPAQKYYRTSDDPSHQWPTCRSSFERVALPGLEPETEVKAWFAAQYGHTLQLTDYRKSPGGKHLTFEQVWNGIPVFNSQVKVNLDNSGHITSVFDNSLSTARWGSFELEGKLNQLNEIQLSGRLPQVVSGFESLESYRKIIFAHPDSSGPIAALEAEVMRTDGALLKVLLNIDGKVLWLQDLRRFHRLMTDTTAKGNVFLPDPLTTAGVFYGGAYKDFDNGEMTVLNAELVEREFTATFRNGAFRLERPWLLMADKRPPSTQVPFRMDGDFRTTRGEDDFEYVHAFYHITLYYNFLVDLGFTSLFTGVTLEVDPHGTNDDNSFFTPAVTPYIIFGRGGVDDAEDADVLIHEFGHAISHAMSPGTNNGSERQALDEGFGDYLAASYSRRYSEFRWGDIFTWDGHNEFWAGRNAETNKSYPIDLSSNIYMTGEIWSGALMDIWEELGHEIADKLALQVMFGTSMNMTLRQAAQLMLNAEAALYSGQYYDVVFAKLFERGLLEDFDTQISGNDAFLRGRGELAVYLGPEVDEGLLEVFDLQGRLVASSTIDRRVNSLPREWFPSYGMYLIRLSGGHQPVVQKAVYIGWP